jgi:hypothetical protein
VISALTVGTNAVGYEERTPIRSENAYHLPALRTRIPDNKDAGHHTPPILEPFGEACRKRRMTVKRVFTKNGQDTDFGGWADGSRYL